MKKTFAIFILAVLVVSALPVFTLPNAKAAASEASVLSYSWYTAPSPTFLASQPGDLVVVGEIQNVGSGFIQNVTLSATAYDSNGTTLGTSTGTAFVFETAPAQKAPFSIDFPPSSGSITSVSWASSVTKVTVTVLSVTDTVVPPYSGLKVDHGTYNFNNSGIYTTGGTIVNNGSETVGYVWVVTTFYDNTGKVVGLNFTNYVSTPYAPLYPGHPTRWVATPADNTLVLTNEIASFAYVIDSMPYSNSQDQSTPTPKGSSSSSQFPLLPVIVVVVIVVVAVVALMLLRKRPEAPEASTAPPPPPPPPPTE